MLLVRDSAVLTSSGEPYKVVVRGSRRDVTTRYDVAEQPTDREPYWGLVDTLGPRAAANPYVRAVLRQRSRVILSNNCYASAILRAKANYVVGSGARCQVLTTNRKYNQRIEQLYHDWADYVEFFDKLRLQRYTMAGDGESFGLFKLNLGATFRHPVKIDYEVAEAEVFSNPQYESINVVNHEDGVILDDYGNVIAYRKFKRHPEDQWHVGEPEAETIKAIDVVHVFRTDRPGQLRGVPEITPALMLHPILRRWTIGCLRAAEGASRINGWMTLPVVPNADEGAEAGDTFDLPPDSWITLPEGAEPKQMKTEHPTTTYPMFKKEVVAECARCVDMPYNVAAGDSGQLNFASGKLDLLPFRRSNDVDQRYLARRACRPSFEHWFEYASLIPGYLPPPPEEISQLDPYAGVMTVQAPRTAWMWPTDDPIDPREAGATFTSLQSGETTLNRIHASKGQDFEEELENGARALGITVQEYREMLMRTIWKEEPQLTPGGAVSQQGKGTKKKPAKKEAAA